MLHKLSYTALVVQSFTFYIFRISFVGKYDLYAAVKESLLTKSFFQHLIIVDGSFLEYFRVSFKGDGGTCFIRLSDYLQRLAVMASVKVLEVDILSVVNGKIQIFRQGVYHRCTNAVESACDLISAAAELSSCVQDSINDCCRRDTLFWVYSRRYTTSVVGDSDNVPFKYFNIYLGTIACKSLVDGVINYLVNKVM